MVGVPWTTQQSPKGHGVRGPEWDSLLGTYWCLIFTDATDTGGDQVGTFVLLPEVPPGRGVCPRGHSEPGSGPSIPPPVW